MSVREEVNRLSFTYHFSFEIHHYSWVIFHSILSNLVLGFFFFGEGEKCMCVFNHNGFYFWKRFLSKIAAIFPALFCFRYLTPVTKISVGFYHRGGRKNITWSHNPNHLMSEPWNVSSKRWYKENVIRNYVHTLTFLQYIV